MASRPPGDQDVTAASPLAGQFVDFVQWVGNGRKLTQKGAITLADARVLIDRLAPETG